MELRDTSDFNNKQANINPETGLRYVAFGDFYTIGEVAKINEAWPELSACDVTAASKSMTVVPNLSGTGRTIRQVIDMICPFL